MTDEEIIEVVSVLKANDKTMKDSGISDNLWGKAVECITFLQFENAELKSSLTHANEECLKWHERTQNLLKDSSGSISGYEKKISDLQTENAALRERLEKVATFALDMCSEDDCAGDGSVGLPPCDMWHAWDTDGNGVNIESGCYLKEYLTELKGG